MMQTQAARTVTVVLGMLAVTAVAAVLAWSLREVTTRPATAPGLAANDAVNGGHLVGDAGASADHRQALWHAVGATPGATDRSDTESLADHQLALWHAEGAAERSSADGERHARVGHRKA